MKFHVYWYYVIELCVFKHGQNGKTVTILAKSGILVKDLVATQLSFLTSVVV